MNIAEKSMIFSILGLKAFRRKCIPNDTEKKIALRVTGWGVGREFYERNLEKAKQEESLYLVINISSFLLLITIEILFGTQIMGK